MAGLRAATAIASSGAQGSNAPGDPVAIATAATMRVDDVHRTGRDVVAPAALVARVVVAAATAVPRGVVPVGAGPTPVSDMAPAAVAGRSVAIGGQSAAAAKAPANGVGRAPHGTESVAATRVAIRGQVGGTALTAVLAVGARIAALVADMAALRRIGGVSTVRVSGREALVGRPATGRGSARRTGVVARDRGMIDVLHTSVAARRSGVVGPAKSGGSRAWRGRPGATSGCRTRRCPRT